MQTIIQIKETAINTFEIAEKNIQTDKYIGNYETKKVKGFRTAIRVAKDLQWLIRDEGLPINPGFEIILLD